VRLNRMEVDVAQ